jgi:branched-chain amino acid transport system ATP-binding protein
MLFETKNLSKHFSGLVAVDKLSMYVNEGEIMGLIGPNGAGKSTVFNLITGVLRPSEGTVTFQGKDITGESPHIIAELGIGRTFQMNPLFPDFTVLENVVASFQCRPKSSWLDIFFNTTAYRKNEINILKQSLEILELVGLYKIKDELAKSQPHGYQKMLGMARALAVKPKLLLLDEPLSGMNPEEIEFALTAIRKTRDQGVTIILVEHNMRVLELCDRVVVISFGKKIAEGLPTEVRSNAEVTRAYFGGSASA